MLIYRLFLLICFLPSFALAQNIDDLQSKVLQTEEMEADLQFYVKALQEVHPGLYKYQSPEEFQLAVDKVKTQIKTAQSFYTFYQNLSALNVKLRCAHTAIYPKKNLDQYLYKGIKTFPYYVYPIQNRLYIIFNGTMDQQIHPGAELLAINGQPIAEVIKRIRQLYWRDGFIETASNAALDGGLFSLFYYTWIEQPNEFNILIRQNGQEATYSVPAQTLAETNQNFGKNPLNKNLLKQYDRRPKDAWSLKFPQDCPSTAYLRIQGFGKKGVNSEDAAAQAMEKFMEQTIKKVNKQKAQHLIIDLRNNAGGWDVMGLVLLKYLFPNPRTFEYYQRQYITNKDSDYLQYGDFSQEEMNAYLKELKAEQDGTFSLVEKQNTTLGQHQTAHRRFKGEIYFLQNGWSASAAAECLAMAKSYGLGTFIGEEAAGSYEGGHSGSFINLELPHSKIGVTIPLLAYVNAVKPPKQMGRGVIPDYSIEQNIEDVLSGFDGQLEKVKQLIRNKSID